jgi:hypothetical protein
MAATLTVTSAGVRVLPSSRLYGLLVTQVLQGLAVVETHDPVVCGKLLFARSGTSMQGLWVYFAKQSR